MLEDGSPETLVAAIRVAAQVGTVIDRPTSAHRRRKARAGVGVQASVEIGLRTLSCCFEPDLKSL